MIFRKPKFNHFRECGYIILVQWTTASKNWTVGGDSNKRLIHLYNGQTVKIEPYDSIKHQYYIRNEIKIFDMTEGQDVPSDAVNMTPEELSLGVAEFHRIVPID